MDTPNLLGLLNRGVRKAQSTGEIAAGRDAVWQLHLLSWLRPGNRFASGNGSKLSRMNRLRDDPLDLATSIAAYR
jgi:hypothetical protein